MNYAKCFVCGGKFKPIDEARDRKDWCRDCYDTPALTALTALTVRDSSAVPFFWLACVITRAAREIVRATYDTDTSEPRP